MAVTRQPARLLPVAVEGRDFPEVSARVEPAEAGCTTLTRRALLPAFVNAHSHSFQRVLRGRTEHRTRADRDTFWTWREKMYHAALTLTPEDLHDAARMCFLEMALADQSGQFDNLKFGVDLTLKQLVSAFEKGQIEEINPLLGQSLDPRKHQAITSEEADIAPNTVVRVMQKGYAVADRLLRPAMVVVAK